MDGSRQYRRGVVLGLSLAELFTVLVFLLLLVLGTYALLQEETLDQKDSLVRDQRDVLVKVLGHEGSAIEPALPEELSAREEGHVPSEEESGGISDDLGERQESLTRQVPAESAERLQEALDALTHTTAAMQKRIQELEDPSRESALRELESKVKELQRTNELLSHSNATQGFQEALDKVKDLSEQLVGLEGENKALRDEIASREDLKGQDSPCWFRAGIRANGEPYERATYIFDVLIDDEHVLVADVAAGTTEYEQQKVELPFDRTGLGRPLTDDEFIRAFEPLKHAAESRKVRSDRRCTFYVAVWDATSETNKRRYKRAHNQVVQAVFNTYEYMDAPWPHEQILR